MEPVSVRWQGICGKVKHSPSAIKGVNHQLKIEILLKR